MKKLILVALLAGAFILSDCDSTFGAVTSNGVVLDNEKHSGPPEGGDCLLGDVNM